MLADDSLIMSQRLSAWTGHGPALEQDIALTNIALDYLGQARNLYQYAAAIINATPQSHAAATASPATEDSLAYLRTERQFLNHLLTELPNGHWGQTVLKVFLFAAYQQPLYSQLAQCQNRQLSGIAQKSLKEVTYHLRWSKDWLERLHLGTTTSRQNMADAALALWDYSNELCQKPPYDPGFVDYILLKNNWHLTVEAAYLHAKLDLPQATANQTGGLSGVHTEHLGYLLAEMQYLQRAFPNSNW
ncbi:MAG: phenylacetate-CoA oxygenase subunit PaaI [Bacteroidetes bacterium]|nr:MAG: phenylacetate-CoA oxygenase subunit PaaI [Bacteroidota bacterium]